MQSIKPLLSETGVLYNFDSGSNLWKSLEYGRELLTPDEWEHDTKSQIAEALNDRLEITMHRSTGPQERI